MFLNQRPLSSVFYTKRSSFDLYIQTYRELIQRIAVQVPLQTSSAELDDQPYLQLNPGGFVVSQPSSVVLSLLAFNPLASNID